MRAFQRRSVPRGRAVLACCLALATTFLAAPGLADVTIKHKVVSSGLGGLGDGTTAGTLVIAGDRSRSDDEFVYTGRFKTLAGGKPRAAATITRLDREVVWNLDSEKKQYTELTFAEMRELMAKGLGEAETAMKQPEKQRAAGEAEMEYTVEVRRTGAKETVNGFAAEQVIIVVKGMPKGKTGAEAGGFTLTMDQWLSGAVPGQAETQAYYRKMAEKLGLDPELQQMGRMAMAQYGGAMREMAAKMKDLKGYPVRSTMTIEPQSGLTPEQQAEAKRAKTEAARAAAEAGTSEEQEKDQQAKAGAAGDLASGNVGGALGGFLGRKLGKAASKKAGEKAAGATAAGEGGPLFKVVNDVLSVSTAPAAGVGFDVPAGYKKVQRGEK